MRIVKCDICKKTIASDAENIQMGYRGAETYASFEFCAECIKPILKILKNKKLIKDNNKKNGGK